MVLERPQMAHLILSVVASFATIGNINMRRATSVNPKVGAQALLDPPLICVSATCLCSRGHTQFRVWRAARPRPRARVDHEAETRPG